MKVTIVGAGNIGTQFAAHCAEKGHSVLLYGSKPEKVQKHLVIVDETGAVIHEGDIEGATSDEKTAFENADLIFVTMPAFCMKETAEKILPYVHEGMMIGLIPGTGGGECAFKCCTDRGAIVFGLQRVPSVARLREYGHIVCATGYRDELHVAAIPASATEQVRTMMAEIFDKLCTAMPNYLNLTLTPSNPILHTTRLRSMFRDYHEGVVYDRIPLFYEDWTDDTSELLFACDDEVQALCAALTQFDLQYVKSLKVHYESATPEALTRKIASIRGFKGITTPQVAVPGGAIPDLNSRYFTADFPYGLSILVQIADFVGLDAPNMKETLAWYYTLTPDRTEFRFADFGITDLESFLQFYLQ